VRVHIDNILLPLRNQLARRLKQNNWHMATAESCTGGWIAKLCTDMPGSSDWFECGIVSYSNASKHRLLGVPAGMIDRHGAVSKEVVLAMLQGLFDRTDADAGVAVSGIAGPGGGTEDKPVGSVWISAGRRNARHSAQHYVFSGDRNQVRIHSVTAAFELIIETLES
jgi:nicotinamide-nucleotide amidase